MIIRSVDYIDWQVSYFLEGKIRTTNLYPNKPFLVNIHQQDSLSFFNQPIKLEPEKEGFRIEYNAQGKDIKRKARFGEIIRIPGISFSIAAVNPLAIGSTYLFKFNKKSEFYGRIAAGLNISEAAKFSSIANVSKTDENPYFAADALNAIIRVYLENDLLEKTQSAKQIIDFIDSQLAGLANAVQSSGERLKAFKQSNNLLDLNSAASTTLSDVTQLETAIRAIDVQLLQLQQLQRQFQKNAQTISLNFNLDGTVDPMLANLLTQWNSLLEERITLAGTFKEKSKSLQEIDTKLEIIKNAAENNIKAGLNRIHQLKAYNQQELNKAYAGLKDLPQQERQLFGLQRDYDINEKIYTYLSEKKLEAQISKASIMSDASSIDPATPNMSPISPVNSAVWRFAVVAGLLSGIGLIFLARMLNPYIYDKETIESLTSTPIIGLIRHFPQQIGEGEQILNLIKPKSLFAESVRSVRTNLSFIAGEKTSKVICVTSEIAGEGKSFVTVNLASSLAMIDKKVIFIAADLRRSQVHKTFRIKNKKGLSTYLSGQNTLTDIIHHTSQENLDLIVAGPTPPNPAELLYNKKVNHLIEELQKDYDYILFDTAPIGLVSDALPLIKLSDIHLFVIRTGKSKYSAASVPERITGEHELKNAYIILNDYRPTTLYSNYYNTQYNDSYYGYYYTSASDKSNSYYTDDEVKKSWWKFWNKG